MTAAEPLPIRALSQADRPAFLAVEEHAFGHVESEQRRALSAPLFEPERSLGAFDGDLLVGTTAIYPFPMTVPGGPLPVAGVTGVSVLPTHRRRGVLRSLMTRQLGDLREHEPVAALWASEPAIYDRFGYGLAARSYALTVARSPSALRRAPTDASLRLRLADPGKALGLSAPVYAAECDRRPGMIGMDARWEAAESADLPEERNGFSPLRCVLAEDEGGVRGYAWYAMDGKWEGGVPHGTVRVSAAWALDPAAYASLWTYLLDLDLTRTVVASQRPVDDPLLHLLTDVRGARAQLRDALFVRLVDLPRALAARRYSEPVDVVLEVSDGLCPWNAGRWRLVGGPDGAECTPSTDAADLTLDVQELGAAYLGGTSLAELAAVGWVQEHHPGALARCARAFRHEPAPFCPFVF